MLGVEEDMYDLGVENTIEKIIVIAREIMDEEMTTEGGIIALNELLDRLGEK